MVYFVLFPMLGASCLVEFRGPCMRVVQVLISGGSRDLPKLTQNEIIYMNKAKEIMFYEIYSIKYYF